MLNRIIEWLLLKYLKSVNWYIMDFLDVYIDLKCWSVERTTLLLMKDLWLTIFFCEIRRLTKKFVKIYRREESFLEPYLWMYVSILAIIYVRFRKKCKIGQDLKWKLFISPIIPILDLKLSVMKRILAKEWNTFKLILITF